MKKNLALICGTIVAVCFIIVCIVLYNRSSFSNPTNNTGNNTTTISQDKKNIDAFVSAYADYQGTPFISLVDAVTIANIIAAKNLQEVANAASDSFTSSQRVPVAVEGKNSNETILNSLPDPTIIRGTVIQDIPGEKIETLNATAGTIENQDLRNMALRLSQMAREQYDPYEKLFSNARQLLIFENSLFDIVISSNGAQNINTPENGVKIATFITDIRNGLASLNNSAEAELGGVESNEMSDLFAQFKGEAGWSAAIPTPSPAPQSPQDNWKVYSPSGENFSVLFPSNFTVSTNSDPADSNYTFKSYMASTINAATSTDYSVAKYIGEPVKPSDPDSILAYHLDRLLKMNPDGHLISKNYTYYHSYRVLDFSGSTDENSSSKVRLILVGQTLYGIGVDYSNGSYDDAEYQKFINSFEIKNIAWYQKIWNWFKGIF